MTAAFSVLLPVYGRDDVEHLRRSFRSITTEQTLPPAQVVVVRDGPVPAPLAQALDELTAHSPVPVTRVDLPVNVGLARALDAGLAACEHEIVARQDADDISCPERFARQIPLLARGFDIVGSAVREFETEAHEGGLVRLPALSEEEIARTARFTSPFNHPTVVYRRSAVDRAGGYQDLALMEDYWLFARMLQAGARGCNVPEPLVHYRVGAGAYARRGGIRLLRSELTLQQRLRRLGFTSRWQASRNVLVRGGYRLVPEPVRRYAYRAFRRLRDPRPTPCD